LFRRNHQKIKALLENENTERVLNYILKNFQWQEREPQQIMAQTRKYKHCIFGFSLVEHPQYSCIVVVHKAKYIQKIIITVQMLPDQFLRIAQKNIYRCSVSE
jgi:hypothetical protein